MKIKSDNVAFGKATIIKTKYPFFLNKLYDIDYNKLRHEKNPPCRYEHISVTEDKQGFWRGIVRNCDELKMQAWDAEKIADTVEVNSISDLLNVPILKDIKKIVENYTKRI